jgi:4-hydroxybenzoate polyprenyltransferase
MTFFPYSIMNASYVLIGSLLAPSVHYDRMGGMALVYLLAVGIGAHSLDAMAPNRPWGSIMSRTQLLLLALVGLVPAVSLGLYYALVFAPLLLPLGVAELFFLLSYNLELFNGRFHTDFWFATSWGFLPVLAGYIVQTDNIGLTSVGAGLFGFTTAFVEINASRPYKELKKNPGNPSPALAARLEAILKGVVATVLMATVFLFLRSTFG